MFTTRRGFAALVSGSFAAAGLGSGLPALARADDGPPNVFFSPHGKPYRAVDGAPYPVIDWFREADHNGDGKLDRDEFVADASAFFDVLDLNGEGTLDANAVAVYEHNIAPEILGVRVTVYANGLWRARPDGARLWLAQYGPLEGPLGDNGRTGSGLPGGPGQGAHGNDPNQGVILPDGVQPHTPDAPPPSVGLVGAALYGLIGDPEPVTASDPDYLARGVVQKARFLAHAHDNFARLDEAHAGYLTLAGLPQTPVQRLLARPQRNG
jgi:hypothetical protein